jgi:omega-6 fatty acid desaturase (delta-12 desaturase)
MKREIKPTRSVLLAITARYRQASQLRSAVQLLESLGGWVVFYLAGLYLANQHSYWAIPCAIGTGLFTVRLFMIQHDCGHGSFFKSRRLCEWLGFALGVLTMTPYHCWYRCHALHHANSGKLEARGIGDIRLLTVAEYQALPWWRRLAYRVYRHPFVLFGIGPVVLFCLRQRFAYYLPADWRKERLSVYATNVLLAGLALAVIVIGHMAPVGFMAFHLGSMAFAASLGVWLFYVQHQFPDAYWVEHGDFDMVRAALDGSSYYHLPAALRWLTANIGFHHIHHLDSRIPNYRLADCHRENALFHQVTRVGLRESLSLVRLKLWDEHRQVMVGFDAVAQG